MTRSWLSTRMRVCDTKFSDVNSMQASFLHYLFGGYLAQLDVIMRKLILELQTCSQCILKTSMRRVNPPIDLEDVALTREIVIGRDPNFHETPHQYILQHAAQCVRGRYPQRSRP